MKKLEHTRSTLLILVFLSYREDFFGNWLLNFGLVAPGVWEPGATSGPLRSTMVREKPRVLRHAAACNRHLVAILTASAFVVALSLCILCVPSPARCDDLDSLIDETLARSGLTKQLDLLTNTMVAAVPDDALPDGMSRKEVNRLVEDAVSEDALMSKMRDAIRLDLNRDALEQVLGFYRSRVGRKVGRLQGRALIPSSIQDVRQGRSIVASLSESRTATLKRIISAQHVYRTNYELLHQMVNGLADGSLGRGHLKAERMRDHLKALVEKARAAHEHTERLALAAYARTLRDLSDAELEEVARFHESAPADWFQGRVQKGLKEAVYMSSKALGEAITETERPGPSASDGGR